MNLPLSRLLLVILATAPVLVAADEGMWTVDNFPAAAVKQKLGVEITPQWLEKVRLSTVRLSGCTASFVSPDGLMLTNHHCVQGCLAQLSSKVRDLQKNGFLANDREQELRCPTQNADILMEVEDITAKVVAATAGNDDQSAGEIRKQTLTRLEQACEQAAGKSDPRRCESVKLYQGGQYFLYKYRRFDDVRLVMAPEEDIAAFGGDPDNFQFPRWCLDMSLLRVYEGGKPVQWPHYLPIRWQGAAEGEAVFVSGHPGTTERLLTVAQLDAQRKQLPLDLLRGSELRGRYIQFAQGGAENARIVSDRLQGLENGIKVRRKQLDALLDGPLMEQKAKDEAALRARTGLAGAQDPWEQIARAERVNSEIRIPHEFLEERGGFGGGYSSLYNYALTLVRGTAEKAKPNEDRLREYTDSALPLLERRLLADVPVYAEREEIAMSLGLMRLREYLGPDHPLVVKLTRTTSPEALAASTVAGTRLGDAAYRKQLWEGGAAAVAASQDPMIRLAAEVDPDARAVRKRYEDQVESPVDTAAERISAARFAAYGTSVYPDATFTLRVNGGTVQGWMEGGATVPPFTYLGRAFERSTGAEPFRLPERWMQEQGRLDPKKPFNNDIVGGNSGSPLINARGELVGLVFDGNIHAISGTYWFDAAQNRSVAVHPAIIKAALTEVYGAHEIAAELGLK
jgi:Peptidase S46